MQTVRRRLFADFVLAFPDIARNELDKRLAMRLL